MAAYLLYERTRRAEVDAERWRPYREGLGPTLAKYGGRVAAAAEPRAVLEGRWQPDRLVILEFPSMERLLAWYHSPEYAPLKALRQQVEAGNVVIMEGT